MHIRAEIKSMSAGAMDQFFQFRGNLFFCCCSCNAFRSTFQPFKVHTRKCEGKRNEMVNGASRLGA